MTRSAPPEDVSYLNDAHRQGGPALRVARLLEQPLVRHHVLRPLRVHVQRVPASTGDEQASGAATAPTVGSENGG